jgi:hypothetical protein
MDSINKKHNYDQYQIKIVIIIIGTYVKKGPEVLLCQALESRRAIFLSGAARKLSYMI